MLSITHRCLLFVIINLIGVYTSHLLPSKAKGTKLLSAERLTETNLCGCIDGTLIQLSVIFKPNKKLSAIFGM